MGERHAVQSDPMRGNEPDGSAGTTGNATGRTIDGVEFQPIPEPWNQRPLAAKSRTDWPTERVEIRDSHRGPGAWIGYGMLRLAQATLGRLPHGPLHVVGRVLAPIVSLIDKRHTQAALDFVQSAFPEKAPAEHKRMVRQSWLHFWDVSLRAPHVTKKLMRKNLGSAFRIYMTAEARELFESEKGLIVVGCHMGHWEQAGVGLMGLGLDPLYAVAKAPRNDPLARYMQRSREGQGGRILPRKDAMKSAPPVIRGGGSIMFMLDHRARKKAVYAPFFGRPAACERSASVLMRRLRAPLVFYACYGSQGPTPYEMHVGPVLYPDDLGELTPAQLCEKLNQQFERIIRTCPEQYFWLHDRFRETPREWGTVDHEGQDVVPPTPR